MNDRHRRERDIAAVLSRHGLTHLSAVSGFDRLRSLGRGALGRPAPEAPYAPPRNLRLALEELGPTFVKLGQLAAARGDLVGPAYRAELAGLQDGVAPIPAAVVREVLEHELAGGTTAAFASFADSPVAAASIGQAHAATLHDGTDVIVKVRRPGAVEEVERDLEILHNAAAHAARRWQAAARMDVVGLAEEFARTLRAELDYLHEARNAERFRGNFAEQPDVRIPRVFWDTTTSRVITLERIRGVKVTDRAGLDAAGIDSHELAARATRVTAKMVFEDGFFHGDPHPGNFFVEPGGRLGLIDFGMVGTLDGRARSDLGSLLVGVVRGDAERLARALLGLGTTTGHVDRAALRADLSALLASYRDVSVGDISLRAVMADVMEVLRRHRLRIPRDLALLVKAVAMEEAMAAELDPRFHLGEALAPYARAHVVEQLSPAALARRLQDLGFEAVDLPRRLLDDGLRVSIPGTDLEPLLARAERLGNRIALSILAAAIIDAAAELAAARRANGRRRAPPAGHRRIRVIDAHLPEATIRAWWPMSDFRPPRPWPDERALCRRAVTRPGFARGQAPADHRAGGRVLPRAIRPAWRGRGRSTVRDAR
jgi:ubiquinone biosynthesis protein